MRQQHPFADRRDAGRRLAAELRTRDLTQPVVLALPRGGVPVGFEVASALEAPLDVVVARKIGAPFQPELGLGAIAEGDALVLDDDRISALGLTRDDLDETIAAERDELQRREERYRGQRSAIPVEGRAVILVDDGLATGVSAVAAARSVRARRPQRVVLAVPVGATQSVARLEAEVDDVVCLIQPPDFRAVGLWYDDFGQTTDDEVIALLAAMSRG